MLAERVRAQVDGLAASGLDAGTFTGAAFDVLRRAVPFVAGCVGTADPATGLVTGTVKYGGLDDGTDDEWAHYEYEVDDPSAFLRVARAPGGVLALSAEDSRLAGRSPRFQDFLRPVWGFDDELRLALRTDDSTWGFMALFREGAGTFTAADQAFLSGVAPALATGLRAGLLVQAAGRPPEVDGPAVVVVDATGEVEGEPPVKRRMYPTKQVAVAQMRIQLENLKSIFVRAIQEARPHPSPDERMRLYAAQYTVMEGANDIARLAIRTCGGQSMMKHLPLERLYRDSRCGALMLPWTAELVLDRMGRETLYRSGEKDE